MKISDKKTEQSAPERSVWKEILSWIEVLVIAAVLALFINNVIIANSIVPTGSMENTIMKGDRVIGLRLSYTFGEPERGDIAIFKFAKACNTCHAWIEWNEDGRQVCPVCGRDLEHAKTIHYVKRVIGVGGDTVALRSSEENKDVLTVYVNGEKLDEPYIKSDMLDMNTETVFTVPEGSYFMMGDNRNNSVDARFWSDPYVNKDRMLAKVLFRYWPGIKSLK